MLWLCDNDLSKINTMEQAPLLTYWAMLNKKIADTKKAIANKPGNNKNHRGRTNTH